MTAPAPCWRLFRSKTSGVLMTEADLAGQTETLLEAGLVEELDRLGKGGKDVVLEALRTAVSINPAKWNPYLKAHREFVASIAHDVSKHDSEAGRQMLQEIAELTTTAEGFVLDENKIVRELPFAIGDAGSFNYIGLLLPREETDVIKVKGKEQTVTHQYLRPAILTSDRKLKPASSLQEDNIAFNSVPTAMKLRISYETIRAWLQGTEQQVTFQEVFGEIKAAYQKFCYFSRPEWYDINSLWDVGSYFFPLFPAYPIYEHRGLKGTAKSKDMSVSRCFTFNATALLINPSEATLFRETHALRPTKYIDEAEKLFRFHKNSAPEPDQRVEFINSSFAQGGAVPRQESDGKGWRTVYYQSYSPTRIASIGGLYGATEDRALIQTHIKPPTNDPRGETYVPPDYEHEPHIQATRNKLYLLALGESGRVRKAYEQLENSGLKNRDWLIWRPILTIASLVSSELAHTIGEFAKVATQIKFQDELGKGSFDYEMLKACWQLLTNTNYVGKLYIKTVREVYVAVAVRDDEDPTRVPKEKSFSSKLDKYGFRDFRRKDEHGSFYEVTRQLFEEVITPSFPSLISDFSSYSSESSGIVSVEHENIEG